MNTKDKIVIYLQEQIAKAEFRVQGYVFDDKNKPNPTRSRYLLLQKYLNDFIGGNTGIRWIVLTGFRGVGKTTILSQLFYNTQQPGIQKLFLSVDQATQYLGVSLLEILTVYEELMGGSFEQLEQPILLFLDEVQYDKQWGLTLKTIYDRSKKVFIFATGSSALSLQENPDIARRSHTEKLFPMSFTEYMKIKKGHFEKKGLADQIQTALFESQSAKETYIRLQKIKNIVEQYWMGLEQKEIDNYLKYGSLPFAVHYKNESLAYDQIKKIIDRIISLDIVQEKKFKSEIITKIPELLYAIAASDTLSVIKIKDAIAIDRLTVSEILDTLEKTELLTRVYPYGSHESQVKKPSKYLFSSPAFRSMYYSFIGNVMEEPSLMGKLTEDAVCLYLQRIFWLKDISLTYDSAQIGADFIFKTPLSKKIILEIGYGKKGPLQINATAERVNPKYGIIISRSGLSLYEKEQIVSVPLSFFLLM